MGMRSSNQHLRLRSAVVRPTTALEAIRPRQNSVLPAQSPWKQKRLTDTQRRRIRRKRAKERDDARQTGALQALDNATRSLVLSNFTALRGRPAGPADREPQWTSIPRSGDPSGGAVPSGGGLPNSDTRQRASPREERFKQFSS